jgi:CubicO group peptidase (beta-lactamase class C family)
VVSPLDAIADWPVDTAAAAAVSSQEVLASRGDQEWRTRIASITKTWVAYAALIAIEDGSLALDQPAGPEGSTVRHLLAHASGLPFNGRTPIAAPGRRRIYSNTGFEVLGETLDRCTGIPLDSYVAEAVFEPLGMTSSETRGSPAHGGRSTVADMARFGRELLAPSLVAAATLANATTEQFTGLAGVIPGLGRYDPNPWGLGFELKGTKSPHWTAPGGSPRTFGHFGGSGTFLWVDPDAHVACVVLTNRDFGSWAPPLWSSLSATVLTAFRGSRARQ